MELESSSMSSVEALLEELCELPGEPAALEWGTLTRGRVVRVVAIAEPLAKFCMSPDTATISVAKC